MNKPIVSIIIPYKNAAGTVRKTMQSILRQSYTNWECILIDDHSIDESEIVLQDALKDGRVRRIKNRRSGISSARNTGLEEISGDYVIFVDADDWLPEKSIELRLTGVFGTNKGGCFGSRIYDESSDATLEMPFKESDDSKEKNCFLFRTSLFESGIKTGLEYVWDKIFVSQVIKEYHLHFDENWERYEDWLFVLSYIDKADLIAVPQNMVYNYVRSAQASTSTTYYKDEFKLVLSLYHKYLSSLAFRGMAEQDCLLGCGHFLINKTIRALHMAAECLSNVELDTLCDRIVSNVDVQSCCREYYPKNSTEKMTLIEFIKNNDRRGLYNAIKRV